jgi:hypothetical protein
MILSRAIGLVVFLVLLYIVNMLTSVFPHPIFILTVEFLNNNVLLIIAMSVLFLIGELFKVLSFPFSLPYPLFSAIGNAILVSFLLKIWEFAQMLTGTQIYLVSDKLARIILIAVFLLVIVGSYISILVRLSRKEEEPPERAAPEEEPEELAEEKPRKKPKRKRKKR